MSNAETIHWARVEEYPEGSGRNVLSFQRSTDGGKSWAPDKFAPCFGPYKAWLLVQYGMDALLQLAAEHEASVVAVAADQAIRSDPASVLPRPKVKAARAPKPAPAPVAAGAPAPLGPAPQPYPAPPAPGVHLPPPARNGKARVVKAPPSPVAAPAPLPDANAVARELTPSDLALFREFQAFQAARSAARA